MKYSKKIYPVLNFLFLPFGVLLGSLGFLVPTICQAQFLEQQDLKFEHLSIRDGLSQNSIKTIFQDSRGYIWLGTEDGLNRYDGSQFYTYSSFSEDSTSLSSGFITALFEDSQGILWIGTSQGINQYDPNTDTFKQYITASERRNNISTKYIRCIYEDSQGALWMGTDGGLRKYNQEKDQFLSVRNFIGLDSDAVLSLYEDSFNTLWMGTDYGLFILDRKNKRVDVANNDYQNHIRHAVSAIFQSSDSLLWIGTPQGLYSYNTLTFEQRYYIHDSENPKSLSSNVIGSILESKKRVLWVATYGGGLSRFDKEKNEFISSIHDTGDLSSLSNDIVQTLYRDNIGAIWIGTYNGLDKFDGEKEIFALYQSKLSPFLKNLVKDDIWAIEQTFDGAVWIGTQQGLYRIDVEKDSSIQVFTTDVQNINSLTDNYILSLHQDKAKVLWIGTMNGGLNRYDLKTKEFTNYIRNDRKLSTGLTNNSVWDILEDHYSNLWVATSGGLSKLDKNTNTFTHYTRNSRNGNVIANNDVWDILEDRYGTLWVATSGGLNEFNKVTGKFKTYDKQEYHGLSNNYITSLFEDHVGNLWLGTHGGLNKFDRKEQKFSHYQEGDGLSNKVIYSIAEDTKGKLWLGTNKGIARFDIAKKKFHNYNMSDGLTSNRFNHGAVKKLNTEEFVFGSIEGVNLFHADSIKDNTHTPPVYITEFKILNKHVFPSQEEGAILQKNISQTKKITLSYTDYVFSFEFVGLNFRQTYKNKYAYKLEGFGADEWIYTDQSKRFATYTNLPQGKYTFKVKAANNDGIWSEDAQKIDIIITPPLWDRIEFQIILALLILTFGFLFYKNHTSREKRQRKKLTQQVKERTQELETEKEKIEKIYVEIVAKNSEIEVKNTELKHKQEEVLTQAEKLAHSYNNINIISIIGQDITTILDLSDISQAVYNHAGKLMDTSGFGIGLFKEDKNGLEFSDYIENGKILPRHYDYLESENVFSVRCFKEKKAIFMNNLQRTYLEKVMDSKKTEGEVPKSLIYLPLITQAETIGVITVQSFKENAYTQEHLTLLKALASYVSIAISNAIYYKKINSDKEKTLDSIRYAKTIQDAMFPTENDLASVFEEFFILFKPKDVVSGDFYWLRRNIEGKTFIAVADCTGHGVPGAFMSMIASRLLNEAISQKIYEPALILKEIHEKMRRALKQDTGRNSDGMDLALCSIENIEGEEHAKRIIFAGAKRPLFIVRDGKIKTIKSSRNSIGGWQKDKEHTYKQEEIISQEGDCLYLITDGFADQNNAANKKYGTNYLIADIEKNSYKSFIEQKQTLLDKLTKHQGTKPQRDDITIIGLKV